MKKKIEIGNVIKVGKRIGEVVEIGEKNGRTTYDYKNGGDCHWCYREQITKIYKEK